MDKYIRHVKDKERGFTLLEMVVTIAGLGVIGITVTTILVNTLRGSSKSTIVNSVRTNGEYALEQMTRTIRYGTILTSPALPCPSSPPGSPPTSMAFVASDGSPITYSCSSGTINSQENNGPVQSLLDTSNVKTSTTCKFVCTQTDINSSPIITISFDLVQKATSSLAEKSTTPLTFTTSVVMQNIHR